jgi:hypothetical protein
MNGTPIAQQLGESIDKWDLTTSAQQRKQSLD